MLAHERHGSGEPLLLIHGIGHRRQAWYPVLDQLAQRFDVILVDLPGHGESSARINRAVPIKDAIRHELEVVLDHLGVERPHVAGNSLGGLVALEMANDGLARSVTALSPAGFWYGALDFTYVMGLFGFVLTTASLGSRFARPLTQTALGRNLSTPWLYAHPGRVDPELAYGDFKNLLHARPMVLRLFESAYTFTTKPGIEDVPVTIAWAEKDRLLLPYQADRARRLLPQARHRWLPDCGHVPMPDDPDLVVDAIIAGTSEVAPAAPAAPLVQS